MAFIDDDARNGREPENGMQSGSGNGGLLAGASLIGAVIASSCCIVPLILVMLGISGAWIGTLTALEPYRPYFVAGTALILGAGYRNVYFMAKKSCDAGSYCASPASRWITKAALWLATLIALLAGTVNFWAPLLY